MRLIVALLMLYCVQTSPTKGVENNLNRSAVGASGWECTGIIQTDMGVGKWCEFRG